MARIPAATREGVPGDQRATFDEFVQERGGVTGGPFPMMLYVPEVAKRAVHFGQYFRQESTLSPKIRELAILTTARALDCLFMWNVHASLGREAGLRDEIVDGLRDKKDLVDLPPDEAAVVNYGSEYFLTHRVSQATFDVALAQLGVRGLMELTNLMGYYSLVGFTLNAFEVEVPADRTELLLPVEEAS